MSVKRKQNKMTFCSLKSHLTTSAFVTVNSSYTLNRSEHKNNSRLRLSTKRARVLKEQFVKFFLNSKGASKPQGAAFPQLRLQRLHFRSQEVTEVTVTPRSGTWSTTSRRTHAHLKGNFSTFTVTQCNTARLSLNGGSYRWGRSQDMMQFVCNLSLLSL